MDAFLAVGVAAQLVLSVTLLLLLLRVHQEVKTLKGQLAIGALASEGEARRVEAIPRGSRSAQEQRHLDAEALKDAPEGETDAGPS